MKVENYLVADSYCINQARLGESQLTRNSRPKRNLDEGSAHRFKPLVDTVLNVVK